MTTGLGLHRVKRGSGRRWKAAGVAFVFTVLPVTTVPAGDSRVPSDSRTVELSVLSYNTHGLPDWLARDRPSRRHRRIGELLNRYDVVLVQEDFTYHERLLESAKHEIVERGNGPSSGLLKAAFWFCGSCGSGLTLFADFPRERLLAVERRSFDACAGWIRFRNDCWVAKGVLHARIDVGNGLEVDFYNLHLDAGLAKPDRDARRRQLAQLREHVDERSAGRAVVIGGDFNLWPGNEKDRQLLRVFSETLRLRESLPAREQLDAGWQGIDRILYRSGDGTAIEAVEASIAEEFARKGKPLSDHPAIRVRFRVTSR